MTAKTQAGHILYNFSLTEHVHAEALAHTIERAITAAAEEERAFFIELCEKVIKANGRVKGDGGGINLLLATLINKVRARGDGETK